MATPYWWTADFPEQYAGDAGYATLEKGKYLAEYEVDKVAALIRAVREDEETEKVAAEFFAAIHSHGARRH